MAAANNLPPEVIARIIEYLIGVDRWGQPLNEFVCQDLARYSTVLPLWQAAVERRTFAQLKLTEERIRTAVSQKILSHARLRYIKRIRLEAVLPSYDEAAYSRVETDDDRRLNDEAFGQTIASLFACLQPFDGDAGQNLDVILSLEAYSMSDFNKAGNNLRLRKKRAGGSDLLRARFAASYLDMPSSAYQGLPALRMISSFEIPMQHRHIDPSCCVNIAARLPRLRTVFWALCDDEKKDLDLRCRLRERFARSLAELPPSVHFMALQYGSSGPANHHYSPANILPDDADVDPLSAALHSLSQRLQEVQLRGISLTADLWGTALSESQGQQQSSWPRLEKVIVTLCPATPAGEWLLERDPRSEADEDEDDESDDPEQEDLPADAPAPEDRKPNGFRTAPAPSLNEWYLAAGSAATQMPALKIMYLRIDGISPCSLDYNVGARRMVVESAPVLELSEEVLEAWQAAARVHAGDEAELEVRYKEELGMAPRVVGVAPR